MRVREITLFPLRIKLIEPFVISLGPLTHAENLFVRIRTDTGMEGWGEASPFPTIHGETLDGALAIGRFLGRLLLGSPINNHSVITTTLNRAIHGNYAIKSAFDMALHDLAAQESQQPLYRYLGGTENRALLTDYTVSLGSSEEMAAAARKIVDLGFSVVKVKLGRGAEEDIRRMEAISAVVGRDIPLRIDANQGWTFEEAVVALSGMERFNIQHCEAPIDRSEWTQLPALRRKTSIPLMADESCWTDGDARRLCAIDAVDRINIKLSKSGGLYTAGRIVAGTTLPLQVGGFLESRLGFSAAAHFALSDPRITFYDFDTPLMFSEDPVEGGIIYGEGGSVRVPETPGLGARLRPEYQLPSRSQNIIQ
ncbi:dipeptide epimerase [Lewinella sp. IMCC34191]|uniref:dipeptide epimerase n=1 Tax=Lewinella sp. IMCC34191 TaxID=2259172 RepID=UPI000E23629E|nr:dipeptide epimerase [Lewinella sp. IMCC34191]